jgi:hypothetical protein
MTMKSNIKLSKIEKDIIRLLEANPGLSDRELSEELRGHRASSTYINQNCRELESKGILRREKRGDGRIGNRINENRDCKELVSQTEKETEADDESQRKIKQILNNYLADRGWKTEIIWGIGHGIDIEAQSGEDRWIIQVEGLALSRPMLIYHFHSVLGEIAQRMDDPHCKYSIALPDIEQFRRLWERLPALAKSRMGITALFVKLTGGIVEEIH